MTDDVRREIRDSFTRQRRNLIAVSLVLLFMQVSGLTLETINVLGNSFTLREPSAVNWALWLAWAYWLLRYWQLFHDLGNRGFKSSFIDRMTKLVPKVAARLVLSQPEKWKKYFPGYEGDIHVHPINTARKSSWHWDVNAQVQARDSQGKVSGTGYVINEPVEVKGRHLLLPKLRSLAHIAFATRLFTEYVLPFLIALVPLGYKLYTLVTNTTAGVGVT